MTGAGQHDGWFDRLVSRSRLERGHDRRRLRRDGGRAAVLSGNTGSPDDAALLTNVVVGGCRGQRGRAGERARAPGARVATEAGVTGAHVAGPALSVTVTLVSVMLPVLVAT